MSVSIPYPRDPEQERRIPVDDVRQLAEQILVSKSMFQFDARTVVDRLLDADLSGVQSHGIRLLERYVRWMDRGDVDPRARVLLEHETEAIALFDGSSALGQVAATKAMKTAIKKAQTLGLGAATVHHSHHLGAASAYACLAAREGLIGYCTSSTGGATVAAVGTHAPAVANHPHAWAFPCGEEPPLVVDFACGAASWGKLDALKRYGLPMPEGIAFDEQGLPTQCHDTVQTVAPAGADRGFGMAMVASILTGALSGGKLPYQKKGSPSAEGSEHFLLAIDPAQFGDAESFSRKICEMRSSIRDLPSVSSGSDILVPGDRRTVAEIDIKEHGLPLHLTDIEMLETLAREHKVDIPWER